MLVCFDCYLNDLRSFLFKEETQKNQLASLAPPHHKTSFNISTLPIGWRQYPHWENARSKGRKLHREKQPTEGDSIESRSLMPMMFLLWMNWGHDLKEQEQEQEIMSDITWTVLSNQRFPPLNLLPAPVNICLNISFKLLQRILLAKLNWGLI